MKVLITGKNSYIGNALSEYLLTSKEGFIVDVVDMIGESWKNHNFNGYDAILHVAAIVHQKSDPKMKNLYFSVNRDLAVEVAEKAKDAGVRKFIFMSTMAVYGEVGEIGKKLVISLETPLNPKSLYAKSKAEAETKLLQLADERFQVVVLRPPMVYGKNCSGNYALLEKLALRIPVFPLIDNQRSMISIQNLTENIYTHLTTHNGGIFHPQDNEYVNTSTLVKNIANANGKKMYLSKFAGILVLLFGRHLNIFKKLFGNLVYDKSLL